MIDTQDETLTPGPDPRAATVRSPGRGQVWWSIPLAAVGLLVLLVISVAALVPASVAGTKEVSDPDDPTVMVEAATPFARTPRSATPVDDRVSFSQLEGVAEVDEDRTGDIYFVTISEPPQSMLSWWVAGGSSCRTPGDCRAEPEIDFITSEEKFGTQTPTQRRTISMEMMRTSSQVAQYVALQALGYDDAKIVPGDVVVDHIVCLEQDGNTCTTYAPADDVL
ncbi:MAG: hypothetical protein ABW328_13615, partial [Ilumatobacteraceae bacterium]